MKDQLANEKSWWRLGGSAAVAGLLVAAVAVGACDDEGEFVAAEPDLGDICAVQTDCQEACLAGVYGMTAYCTRGCAAEPCPAGYYCVGRAQMGLVCAMTWCSGDGDCPAEYRCDVDESICVHHDIACGVDTDCPAATACNQGVCATVCSSSDDCKQGYQCDHHLGCVQCLRASDCSEGLACVGGVCNQGCVDENDCRMGYECLSGGCQIIVGGGVGDVGVGCQEHSECVDFCMHHSYCTRVCDGPDDTSCPDGYHCQPDHLVCSPSS